MEGGVWCGRARELDKMDVMRGVEEWTVYVWDMEVEGEMELEEVRDCVDCGEFSNVIEVGD